MVRRKLGRKDILIAVAGGVVTIAVLTFYLWHSTENVRLGYSIGRAEDEIHALRSEIRILETKKAARLGYSIGKAESEIHDLRSEIRILETKKAARLAPAVVDKTAREKLGLADPREDQIIIEDD